QHALPAAQHRPADRLLRREAGRHRAAEHGGPGGRGDRAQHEGRHRQRLLQAGQDGDRPDRPGASLHRARHQDPHRHPREQVPEPRVNPDQLVEGLTWFVVFIFSTTLHEAGHAFAAWRLGDSTAYEGGQVSLNPIPHIRREPVGMVLVPILSVAATDWMMGWASAPYDPTRAHRHPRRAALMALAGPLANLLLVLLAGGAIRLGTALGAFYAPDSVDFEHVTAAHSAGWIAATTVPLSILFSLNLLLFVFNLLPLPPLDGSA